MNVSDDAAVSACLNETSTAQVIGISVHTLRSWRKQKRGPAWIKVGTRVLYRRAAIEAFLELHTSYTVDSPAPSKRQAS